MAISFELGAQTFSTALTNEDVVKLEHASLGDALVIAIIQRMPARFTTDSDSLEALKTNGVSVEVITAMVKKASSPVQPQPNQPDADGIHNSCPGGSEIRYRLQPEHQWALDAGVMSYSVMFYLVVDRDGAVLKAEIDKLTGQVKRGEGIEAVDIPDKAKGRLSQRLIAMISKWRFAACIVDQQPVLCRARVEINGG